MLVQLTTLGAIDVQIDMQVDEHHEANISTCTVTCAVSHDQDDRTANAREDIWTNRSAFLHAIVLPPQIVLIRVDRAPLPLQPSELGFYTPKVDRVVLWVSASLASLAIVAIAAGLWWRARHAAIVQRKELLKSQSRMLPLPLPPHKWHVFLSYRVTTDADLVGTLYDKLRSEGLHVWLDSHCLVDGTRWEEGFADGLIGSAIFVPVLSKAGLKPFSSLSEQSPCDNLMLELRLATALKAQGHLRQILPVLVGEPINDLGLGLGSGFASFHHGADSVPASPELTVASVEAKASEHLRRAGFSPLQTPARIPQTVDGILQHQCVAVQGVKRDALDAVVAQIVAAAVLRSNASGEVPPPPSPFDCHLFLSYRAGVDYHVVRAT